MAGRRWKPRFCSIAVDRNSGSFPTPTVEERHSCRTSEVLTLRDPRVLPAYVGEYELQPGIILNGHIGGRPALHTGHRAAQGRDLPGVRNGVFSQGGGGPDNLRQECRGQGDPVDSQPGRRRCTRQEGEIGYSLEEKGKGTENTQDELCSPCPPEFILRPGSDYLFTLGIPSDSPLFTIGIDRHPACDGRARHRRGA